MLLALDFHQKTSSYIKQHKCHIYTGSTRLHPGQNQFKIMSLSFNYVTLLLCFDISVL
jgi:hypothetical protein